ncbi:ATP-binding protein [Sphingorhabdus sp. EL138]|uniref:ATP-binding protein n=1 Tax=Sphingorhabdus sp. EL138 TaxID=2073156 RepID=UPI0013A52C07|nr:ATP-binding protein [Sphingorhabdus sp. EL138]
MGLVQLKPRTESKIVGTSVVRLLMRVMQDTHERRGISVISGPWGIGKTTTINELTRKTEDRFGEFIVVKVENGTNKQGSTARSILQRIAETMRMENGERGGMQLSGSLWQLRQMVFNLVYKRCDPNDLDDLDVHYPITIIFDEAQRLSREAIEMLRDFNDRDRTTGPIPLGLIFIGNNEFALDESLGRDSVIAGAVRSRLLYEEQLTYANLSNDDLAMIAEAKGITDKAAIKTLVGFFNQPRVKRDLRQMERVILNCERYTGGAPTTVETVRHVLNP